MPIYEYRCDECRQIFEEWQTTFEDKDLNCPICGGSSQRVMSNTSFVLKGTGWYTTDYCNKSTPASDSGNGNGTSAEGNGNGSAAKAETKSETSAPAASKASKPKDSGAAASKD